MTGDHRPDVQKDMVPVIADFCYFYANVSCCLEQQLRAPFLEFNNVEDIVAVFGFEAKMSFDSENAGTASN